ncbi:MAG: RNA repair domain-containing protein [Polyangiaceae bacterium]
MRTSEHIYQRIRWDARFDPARFVLGIEARRDAPARVPFADFVPGGEIPWHRVVYIEADRELVWDRRTQIDRLDTSRAGRARAPRLLDMPFFEPRHALRWDGAEWSPAVEELHPFRAASAPEATTLRVATWNVLWDKYETEWIETERRRPLIVAALRALDADVLALQEVEPPLHEELLSAGWVRARYAVTSGSAGSDVERFGLVVLARPAVREVGLHALGPHKAALAITVDTAAGPVVFATTHLTSDHTEGATERRARELAELRAGFAGRASRVIWGGDFNDAAPDLADRVDLLDAWTLARGDADETPTFDPETNGLAEITSSSSVPRRLDRVFVSASLDAVRAELAGTEPATGDGLFLSDHYGLVVDLRLIAETPCGPSSAR